MSDAPCGILLPLNSRRHWNLGNVTDLRMAVPWGSKRSEVTWRGSTTGSGLRRDFVRALASEHDVRFNAVVQGREDWVDDRYLDRRARSRRELLAYRYLLVLPGNDVATGLKWALASNSVVLMPDPTKETWLMEGLLRPWVHYVPVNHPRDVAPRLTWLRTHAREALAITYRANAWIDAVLAEFDSPVAHMRLPRFGACPPRGSVVRLSLTRAEFGIELQAYLPYGWWLYETCQCRVDVEVCAYGEEVWWFAERVRVRKNCLRDQAHNIALCTRWELGWTGANCHNGTSLLPGLSARYGAGLRKAVALSSPSSGTVGVLNHTEWGRGILNTLSADLLEAVMRRAERLVYSRADWTAEHGGWDEISDWPEERRVLARATEVVPRGASVGTQLRFLSRADVLLATQGGNARIAALLQRPTVVLHVAGSDNYEDLRHWSGNSRVTVVRSADAALSALSALLARASARHGVEIPPPSTSRRT